MYNYYSTPTAVVSGVLQRRHFSPWSFNTFILIDVRRFSPNVNCRCPQMIQNRLNLLNTSRTVSTLNTFYAINNNINKRNSITFTTRSRSRIILPLHINCPTLISVPLPFKSHYYLQISRLMNM